MKKHYPITPLPALRQEKPVLLPRTSLRSRLREQRSVYVFRSPVSCQQHVLPHCCSTPAVEDIPTAPEEDCFDIADIRTFPPPAFSATPSPAYLRSITPPPERLPVLSPSLVSQLSVKERCRRWLLRPGHLEGLFWLCGTALLVGVSVLVTLAVLLRLGLLAH